MAKLVIFGTGDAGCLAHYYFARDTNHEVVAFTVDREYASESTFQNLPVVEFDKAAHAYPPSEHKMFIAVGYSRMNQVRAAKYFAAKKMGFELVTYISSRCTFLSNARVGDNCFVLEDTTIQPFVQIQNNVTLWSGTHIGHHSVIEDHCFLAPRVAVAGRVRIGPYCFIGVNTTIRNAVTIAPHTLVGAGANITKNTAEHGVYIPTRTEPSSKKSFEIDL